MAAAAAIGGAGGAAGVDAGGAVDAVSALALLVSILRTISAAASLEPQWKSSVDSAMPASGESWRWSVLPFSSEWLATWSTLIFWTGVLSLSEAKKSEALPMPSVPFFFFFLLSSAETGHILISSPLPSWAVCGIWMEGMAVTWGVVVVVIVGIFVVVVVGRVILVLGGWGCASVDGFGFIDIVGGDVAEATLAAAERVVALLLDEKPGAVGFVDAEQLILGHGELVFGLRLVVVERTAQADGFSLFDVVGGDEADGALVRAILDGCAVLIEPTDLGLPPFGVVGLEDVEVVVFGEREFVFGLGDVVVERLAQSDVRHGGLANDRCAGGPSGGCGSAGLGRRASADEEQTRGGRLGDEDGEVGEGVAIGTDWKEDRLRLESRWGGNRERCSGCQG